MKTHPTLRPDYVFENFVIGENNTFAANAADTPLEESLYIGCGCFWHLQHSVAVFERDQLGRKGGQLTCQTGYAGGLTSERVCYHNAENVADYSQLGHAEAVAVQVPSDRVMDLVEVYLKNFDPTTKGMYIRS